MRLNYLNFTRNFFLNNLSHGFLYNPLNAQIELTMRCNARCVFCSIWKKDYQNELDNEMTTEQVKKLINEMVKLKVQVLTFTGGEPTLRSDLSELITYAHQRGMFTSIATNGYYLYDLIKNGKLDDLEWAIVSIDWPDAERHNKYRNLDVFDRAIKGIRAAIKRHIKIVISTVVTSENINYMEEMCKFSYKLGTMAELLPCENIVRDQKGTEHIVEDVHEYIPDLHQYADEIRRLAGIYPNLITDTISAAFIEAGGFGKKNLLDCMSAQSYIFIRYNGEYVLPCKIHPLLSIDVKKHHLDDAYYSKEVRELMLKRDSFSFCDGCRLGCAITSSIPAKWVTLYEKFLKAFLNGNLF